jgi:hypothetical protein
VNARITRTAIKFCTVLPVYYSDPNCVSEAISTTTRFVSNGASVEAESTYIAQKNYSSL